VSSFPGFSSSFARRIDVVWRARETGWALLAGCGTTFAARVRRGISCRSVVASIAVRRPSSFTRCADWPSMRRAAGVRLYHFR
jgi:hypothetical protein